MKKPSISLDKEAIQAFFLNHGEKLALGVVGLVFLWIAYGAITRDTYEKVPADLDQLASRTRSHVTDPQRQPEPTSQTWTALTVPQYSEQLTDSSTQIASNPPWGPMLKRIFDQAEPRGEPEYLAPTELVATPGYGAVDVKPTDAAAGSATRGVRGLRWAALTALVPVDLQAKKYNEKFMHAAVHRKEADLPSYAYFTVQRRDVTEGVPADDTGWELVDIQKVQEIRGQFARDGAEVVASGYLDPELSLPLPPLYNSAAWTDATAVAHPPQIPMMGSDTEEDAPAQPQETASAEETRTWGPRTKRDNEKSRKEKDEKAQRREDEKIPYVLLRFFDFTVEPGRRYQYRSQVYLDNPNLDLSPRDLATPELARGEFRSSSWSNPSNVVVVPYNNDLVAGSVTPERPGKEPQAEVVIHQWKMDQGLDALKQFSLVRGQTANFQNVAVNILPHGQRDPMESDVSFNTNTMLIDMTGGETVAGSPRVRAPAELIFLDPDGRLILRSELNDQEKFLADMVKLQELGGVEDDGRRRGSRRNDDDAPEDPFGGSK
jgi:hypothetical protein